jgi:hypothetical protein
MLSAFKKVSPPEYYTARNLSDLLQVAEFTWPPQADDKLRQP